MTTKMPMNVEVTLDAERLAELEYDALVRGSRCFFDVLQKLRYTPLNKQ